MGCSRMVMKALIVLLVFYLIGVFGVTAGYFSKSWDSGWNPEYQINEAVSAATRWPLLTIELLTAH